MENSEFFARCASGFESLLAEELKRLKIKRIRPLKGGVAFFCDIKTAYRVCLWSRLASRVLFVLARVDATNADILYESVRGLNWERYIKASSTISVYAHGFNENLRNTQFSALKTKDAICDCLRLCYGVRPDVKPLRADVVIDVSIHNAKATISLDMSGESLHRRGYRDQGVQTAAPLKESLAAALVLESGWGALARTGIPFVDPLCGSGTLAIEAAMIAADRAPGLSRDYWGFAGWATYDAAAWSDLLDEADERFAAGLQVMPPVLAGDIDPSALAIAEANAKRAGFAGFINFFLTDVADLKSYLGSQGAAPTNSGLIVTNPPYGERLGSKESLEQLYDRMHQGFSSLSDGWHIAIITPDESIDAKLGMIAVSKKSFYNGSIETELRHYIVDHSAQVVLDIPDATTGAMQHVKVLEANSEQFAARFRKVFKERKKWAKKQGIQSYRVYDADLPDYAVAVDVYEGIRAEKNGSAASDPSTRGNGNASGMNKRGNPFLPRPNLSQKALTVLGSASESIESESLELFLVVTEYKAPKTIDEDRARRRFSDALTLISAVAGVPPKQIFAKERRQEKGGGQYRESKREAFIIYSQEAGLNLELDLNSYLDTGLFLDHRITRMMLGRMAEGKSFLNLFAYTGVASVHSAAGGALSTTSVDLSNTYLSWAKRNMALNGFEGEKHRFIRRDVLDWINQEIKDARLYDLIFVDPPTFSNSKAMGKKTWSVERDHVDLLSKIAKLLSPEGLIVFSCNLRNFKLEAEKLKQVGLAVRDITPETIPEDFKRNPKIHHCYLLQKIV